MVRPRFGREHKLAIRECVWIVLGSAESDGGRLQCHAVIIPRCLFILVWKSAAAEWPASRLLELWNSFAGVAPFTDCKPVKKFENRDKALTRIWTTIQRLGNAIAPKPVEDAKPPEEAKPAGETKKAGKPKAAKSAKPTPKAK